MFERHHSLALFVQDFFHKFARCEHHNTNKNLDKLTGSIFLFVFSPLILLDACSGYACERVDAFLFITDFDNDNSY